MHLGCFLIEFVRGNDENIVQSMRTNKSMIFNVFGHSGPESRVGDHLLRAQGAVGNCAQKAAILRGSNWNGGREGFER